MQLVRESAPPLQESKLFGNHLNQMKLLVLKILLSLCVFVDASCVSTS